jgi:hypothetical protein
MKLSQIEPLLPNVNDTPEILDLKYIRNALRFPSLINKAEYAHMIAMLDYIILKENDE